MKKMRFFIRKNSYILQLLGTIFVLICVPLLIMELSAIDQATNELKKNNAEYYTERLAANAEMVESQIASLSTVASRIGIDRKIQTPLNPTSNEYDLYVAANVINDYSQSIPYVKTTGVYYRANDYFLQNGNRYYMDVFCDMVAQGNGVCSEAIMNTFENETQAGLFSTMGYSEVQNILYFIRPFSTNAQDIHDIVVYFALDTEILSEMMSTMFPENSALIIMDDKGTLLLRTDHSQSGLETAVFQNYLTNSNSVFSFDSDYGEKTIYKYTNLKYGYTYFAVIDQEYLESNISSYAENSRKLLYFSLLTILLLLPATVYIAYRPLRKFLSRRVTRQSADNRGYMSELELLDSEFFLRDNKISSQKNLLMNFMVGDLLFGSSVDPDLTCELFPKELYRYFVVALIDCDSLSTEEADMVTQKLENQLGGRVLITSTEKRMQTVAVCAFECEQNITKIKEYIALFIEESTRRECQIYCGGYVTEITNIRDSYHDALLSSISRIEDSTAMGDEDYPAKEVQELVYGMHTGNKSQALTLLDIIEEKYDSTYLTFVTKRYYCFRLLVTILPIIQNAVPMPQKDVEKLLGFHTVPHLFVMLREVVSRACDKVKQTEEDENDQVKANLLAYVDSNFRDRDLCLTSVADYMHLSIYAVSRLFKEATKRGFKDYVMEKRLQYACTLLESTDQAISNIAVESGFSDGAHFSAVFKSKYGIQPSKYRKNAECGDMNLS